MKAFIKALFFVVVAERRDKTKLMSVVIAADYHQTIFILQGTTCGMMVAEGIGIAFMFFGTAELYNSVSPMILAHFITSSRYPKYKNI